MWTFPKEFDVIVIGAGHAGCEAAYVSACMGAKTALITMNIDTIAKMSCNPAIGGTAKGHIVREIDALGGIMGKIADQTGIQFRMLNASKGPAVWSPRAQIDKQAYHAVMKQLLERLPNLHLIQGTIESLVVNGGHIEGIETMEGIGFTSKSTILTVGTFIRGLMHIGETNIPGGRAGDKPSIGLSRSLEKLGFRLGRLKTGTPPRIHKRGIDLSLTEEQPGEGGISFSFDYQEKRLPQISCYITYTNQDTQEVVLQNIEKSPLYSGKIKGVGPRYCPSIEDKMVRFPDRERHQVFLEPEGLTTDEIYVNGLSTSLPLEIQYQFLQTIPALKRAEILRPGYAIEYDYVASGQLFSTLETKKIENLYFAGQINGTTGYEEAASQGLIAGINAVNKLRKLPPFTLKRSEAYIGVMIDDIISKDLDEPYRMFTSRAEHRLLLRQDNADLRLRHYGYALGLINKEQHRKVEKKRETINSAIAHLKSIYKKRDHKSVTLAQLLMRPEMTYQTLCEEYLEVHPLDKEIQKAIEIELKYHGYFEREQKEIKKLETLERMIIPNNFPFADVVGLRNEAKEKLIHHTPNNLGQASRISGVSPADITLLMVTLDRNR